jgi:hypothetical protein
MGMPELGLAIVAGDGEGAWNKPQISSAPVILLRTPGIL